MIHAEVETTEPSQPDGKLSEILQCGDIAALPHCHQPVDLPHLSSIYQLTEKFGKFMHPPPPVLFLTKSTANFIPRCQKTCADSGNEVRSKEVSKSASACRASLSSSRTHKHPGAGFLTADGQTYSYCT